MTYSRVATAIDGRKWFGDRDKQNLPGLTIFYPLRRAEQVWGTASNLLGFGNDEDRLNTWLDLQGEFGTRV